MLGFKVKRLDASDMRVWATDPDILKELSVYFTFDAPNYQRHPLFRRGIWDGKIRMFNAKKQTLPTGLFSAFLKWTERKGYEVNNQSGSWKDFFPELRTDLDEDSILEWIDSLQLSSNGEPLDPHEHQEYAILEAIQRGRLALLSPTASGKSLVLYCLSRWYQNEIDPAKKILIIVPTKGLVTQLYKDFKDYSGLNGWNTEQNVHFIYSGQAKSGIEQQIIITTWQSIYKLPKTWFDDFEVVIADECHHFKSANSLTKILKKMPNCNHRFGCTGTLDGTNLHQMVVESCFGEIIQPITTREMMDKDLAAKLRIDCIKLVHQEPEASIPRKYHGEIDYLVAHSKRNRFIADLALSLEGNTLILFNYVDKHGKPLHKLLQEKMQGTGRSLHYVSGETKVVDRELVRSSTEQDENAIITASFKTFSTGINIKRLHNIILASPTKARIQLLQSIGRELRKHESKDIAVFYDISDDLGWKGKPNYTLRHFNERCSIYRSEKFDYDVSELLF